MRRLKLFRGGYYFNLWEGVFAFISIGYALELLEEAPQVKSRMKLWPFGCLWRRMVQKNELFLAFILIITRYDCILLLYHIVFIT